MESRLVLAIEVAKAAQPVIESAVVGADNDSDAPDEDAGGELQPHIPSVEVAAIAAATATTGVSGAPTFDEEGPVWPDESSESAMRAEVTGRGETLSSKAAKELAEAAAEAAAEKKDLPTLGDLVNRLPDDVRDTVEDLFRVKWTKVTRVPRKALKE